MTRIDHGNFFIPTQMFIKIISIKNIFPVILTPFRNLGRTGKGLLMQTRKLLILLLLFVITCNEPFRDTVSVPEKTDTVMKPDTTSLRHKAEWIDSIFTRLSRHNWFNGAILYAEKGHIVYKNAFGYSNFQTRDTLSTHSAFQLASVSKTITAMGIMILKEQGRLSYEDTIQQYLPCFPYPGVSIRNLLNHRSGLSRYMSLSHDQWHDKEVPLTNQDMLNLYQTHVPSPYFRPDNGFHYCNTNYALLACIIEKAGGMPYDHFVQKEIFDPLGMKDSFVYTMEEDSVVPFYVPAEVMGHRYWKWRPIRIRNEYLNGVMGDKGIYASVEDLYRFDLALNNHTLVSAETLQEAFTPGSQPYWKRRDNYGFGWRIKETRDSTVYHFGWWKGFRAYYIRDMKEQKTIIALCNKDKGPGSSNLWKIIRDTSHFLKFTPVQETYVPIRSFDPAKHLSGNALSGF